MYSFSPKAMNIRRLRVEVHALVSTLDDFAQIYVYVALVSIDFASVSEFMLMYMCLDVLMRLYMMCLRSWCAPAVSC